MEVVVLLFLCSFELTLNTPIPSTYSEVARLSKNQLLLSISMWFTIINVNTVFISHTTGQIKLYQRNPKPYKLKALNHKQNVGKCS